MQHVKLRQIQLKNHPSLNERWVQDVIAEDPSILGIGDVVLKDKERVHRNAGRLDLLLQEADGHGRYEVEIQRVAARQLPQATSNQLIADALSLAVPIFTGVHTGPKGGKYRIVNGKKRYDIP